jgi:hypothetical protein
MIGKIQFYQIGSFAKPCPNGAKYGFKKMPSG